MTTMIEGLDGLRGELAALRLSGQLYSPHLEPELRDIVDEFISFIDPFPLEPDFLTFCPNCFSFGVSPPAFDERDMAGVTA